MGKVFIEEQNLTAIGDAIREKTGKSDLLNPTAMPEEIKNIETGSAATVPMVRVGTGYEPEYVSAYQFAGYDCYRTGTSTGNKAAKYYWYRSSGTNIYWNVARWNSSKFIEGHEYRVSFYIWHNGDVSNEPIKFFQSHIFINASISVPNPITEIRREPQLVSFTITFVPDSNYHFGLWLYPEDSGNEVRLTPAVIEDLTNPITNAEMPL